MSQCYRVAGCMVTLEQRCAPSVSGILQGNHEGQKLCFEPIDSFVCIRALLDFSV
jgi:hypothetical protein